jgi:hypothetical protein
LTSRFAFIASHDEQTSTVLVPRQWDSGEMSFYGRYNYEELLDSLYAKTAAQSKRIGLTESGACHTSQNSMYLDFRLLKSHVRTFNCP